LVLGRLGPRLVCLVSGGCCFIGFVPLPAA